MPYFPSSKTLFLHIPKNAGKYIEDRFGMSTYPGREVNQPNRSLLSKLAKIALNLDSRMRKEYLAGMIDIGLVGQHLTLTEIIHLNLISDFNNIKIFTIARNPFTRIKSLYCHHQKASKWSDVDLEEFCKNWKTYRTASMRHNIIAHKRSQYDFVDNHHNQSLKVNSYKLEGLDIQEIANYIQLKVKTEQKFLRHGKLGVAFGYRKREDENKKKSLRLTAQSVKYVLNDYGIDFDFFSYSRDYEP